MNAVSSRREFLRAATVAGTGLALASQLPAEKRKSILVFTKSSGWEHDVVKKINGQPSIVDRAVTEMGVKYGFDVKVSKDGRIFDTQSYHHYSTVVFFTTGDLTTLGTDGKPPMTPTERNRCWRRSTKGWALWECTPQATRFTPSLIPKTFRTATSRMAISKMPI